jgi:benzil reductase ((S)-benzoin forming)
MKTKYCIITGASRGIGESIARKLLTPGNTLICISRKENSELVESASNLNIPLFYIEADLGIVEQVISVGNKIFNHINLDNAAGIALINNAGMVQPIAAVGRLNPKLMETHLHLNLLAPALLCNLFIEKTTGLPIPKVILNISSGAAAYPYAGWSMYCSGKAGIAMLTKVIELEQEKIPYPVKVFSLAPGIIETSMQEELRNADNVDFPTREHFVNLFNEGKLISPSTVADVVARSLFNPEVPQGGNLTLEQLKGFELKF